MNLWIYFKVYSCPGFKQNGTLSDKQSIPEGVLRSGASNNLTYFSVYELNMLCTKIIGNNAPIRYVNHGKKKM